MVFSISVGGGPPFVNPTGLAVGRHGDIFVGGVAEYLLGEHDGRACCASTGERTTLSSNTSPAGTPALIDPFELASAPRPALR